MPVRQSAGRYREREGDTTRRRISFDFALQENEFVLSDQLVSDLSQLGFEDLGVGAHAVEAEEFHIYRDQHACFVQNKDKSGTRITTKEGKTNLKTTSVSIDLVLSLSSVYVHVLSHLLR